MDTLPMFTVQSISSYLDDHAQEAANLFSRVQDGFYGAVGRVTAAERGRP
jgi:hypothetical protein